MNNHSKRRTSNISKSPLILKNIRKLLQNASIYLFIVSMYIATAVNQAMAIVSAPVGDVNGVCDEVPVGGTCSEISWFGIKAAAVFFGSLCALCALMNLIQSNSIDK